MKTASRNACAKRLSAAATLVLTMLFTGYAWSQAGVASDEGEYRIQPGDLLHVSVWKEPDLTREVLVRPDGGLSFPLVGGIAAEGMSISSVRKIIAERLARYVSDPVVTVSVHEVRGNAIYVIGEVHKPGEFVARRRIDVMQALSMAGGTTEYASRNNIVILRRDPATKQQTAMKFRYGDIAAGHNLEQNIILRAGDVVLVP